MQGSNMKSEKPNKKQQEIEPLEAEEYNQLGTTKLKKKLFDEAEALFRQAIKLDSTKASYFIKLARVLSIKGYPRQSIQYYQQAIEIEPENATAHAALGEYYLHLGRLEDAESHLSKAVSINKNHDLAYTLLAEVNFKQAKKEAIPLFQLALKINPNNLRAINGLAGAYCSLRDFETALQYFQQALSILPASAGIYNNMAKPLAEICDWDGRDKFTNKFQQAITKHIQNPSSALLEPFGLTIYNFPIQFRRNVAAHRARGTTNKVAPIKKELDFKLRRASKNRVRIAYLSADLRFHPTGVLTQHMYQHHDRSKFEIYAYYLADISDKYTKTIQKGCDHFKSIYNISTEAAASMIYDDKVDVLLDMAGYTINSRTEILALQPAKSQINYLGYLDTMGADFIQYMIADETVIPQNEQSDYQEKILYMPNCFMPAGPISYTKSKLQRENFGLPRDAFVFCCHNNIYKIDPTVFKSWMNILQQVTGSVLWLFDNDCLTSIKNLRGYAKRYDIDPKRLIFSKLIDFPQYLNRYQLADLFLDTYIYNAGATAIYALTAGLPILTKHGHTFLSRMCSSVNTAVGMEEMICKTAEEYEQKAIRLAKNPEALKKLRDKLKRNETTEPLFDIKRYVKDIEKLYLSIS